jgi:hypothetical protein
VDCAKSPRAPKEPPKLDYFPVAPNPTKVDFDTGFANVRRWREAFAKRPSVDLPL